MKIVHAIHKLLESNLKQALQTHITELGYEDVVIGEVREHEDGIVEVEFIDEDGDQLAVLFVNDEEEGAEAIILGDEEEDEMTMVDLDALHPPLINGNLDMRNVEWLNDSALDLIFSVDDEFDAEDISEKKAFVIRGGKKIKVGLARRKKRKILTSKQRQGIRKAVRSRKKVKAKTARKRKKSLKVRKRMNLKTTKNRGKFLLRK